MFFQPPFPQEDQNVSNRKPIKKTPKPAGDDDDLGHPSQDTSCRFATDQLLRDHGFTIWMRKKGQEPLWKRDGNTYCQSLALELIGRPDLVEDARYAEELDGFDLSLDLDEGI